MVWQSTAILNPSARYFVIAHAQAACCNYKENDINNDLLLLFQGFF
jgi:hypothetical protein